ncbi:MAG: efflux RND transporter periplasmic adaptor subunit [Planctomycetes bacterium]|nr:efflux RND transporter periplasmic adaptor subunit [Planctomycetota bacterium]
MKTIIGFAGLVGVVIAVYAVNQLARTDDGKSVLHVAEELPVKIETAQPTQRDIIRTVNAPGDVEPYSEVDISAEVVAKILEMPIEEGDAVKKGDLLCRLDDADYRARVTSAKANIAKLEAVIIQAEADLEKADRDFNRQVRLSEADATSATELADYHTALIRAQAALEVRRQELIEAEALLQSALEDQAKTVITAPIDGIVSQLFAKQGEVVITGTMNNPGTRIMVISDLSQMQVRCRVAEGDAPLVKQGHQGRIYLQSETENSIAGHVHRVATKGTKPVGRDVVTFETLVLVDEDDVRVRPGMTANVEIEVERSLNALTIPVQAVVHRKRRDLPEELLARYDELQGTDANEVQQRAAEYLKIVFCIEDNVAHPHLVETGISDSASVEILQGLALDGTVVVGPFRSLDQLKDGSRIEIEDKDKDKGEETGDHEPEDEPAEGSSASSADDNGSGGGESQS